MHVFRLDVAYCAAYRAAQQQTESCHLMPRILSENLRPLCFIIGNSPNHILLTLLATATMAKVIHQIDPNADTVIILKNPLVHFAVWNDHDVE